MAATRIHRSCCARSSRPTTATATSATPGSAAPPTPTSPRRSAAIPDLVAHRALLAAIGAGEAEPDAGRPGARGRPGAARSASARRSRVERDADRVCAAFLLGASCSSRGGSGRSRARSPGVIGAGAFVRFGGELGDVYEGFFPARLMRGERFDLNETETALVGRRTGRGRSAGRSRSRFASSRSRRRAAASTWLRPAVATMAESGRRKPVPKTASQRSGRRGHEPPRAAQVRAARQVRVRDRAARHRGQVAAGGQGPARSTPMP